MDKENKARVTWISKQLEYCQNKSPALLESIKKDLWVEADIKYTNSDIKEQLSEFDKLREIPNDKDSQGFSISLVGDFGGNFSSVKKFVELIEAMTLNYYEGVFK